MLLLFVGSGCAALIYEIVWFQLLQLVIGSSAVSLGVLLGTFMGGMCLGSFCCRGTSTRATIRCGLRLPRARHRRDGPAAALRHAARQRHLHGDRRRARRRCARSSRRICLLPPTLLMGATLPAIARWVRDDAGGRVVARVLLRRQHRRRGLGCLLAGFYLLRVHDMAIATYVAVALNVLVAVDRRCASRRSRRTSRRETPRRRRRARAGCARRSTSRSRSRA